MTELATAAAALRTLGPGDAVPNDFVVPYYLGDIKRRIAVARIAGRLYAFDDLCTCGERPCPLSGGLLTGTTLMCECHGSRFDVTTGAVRVGPAIKPLKIYEVAERRHDTLPTSKASRRQFASCAPAIRFRGVRLRWRAGCTGGVGSS